MVFSNVIVDVTFDLAYCSLSGLRFVFMARLLSGLWRDERNCFATHLTAYKTRLIIITTFLLRTMTTRNTHSNTDSNTLTNVNSDPVTTATIPYIRGTSENIARILQAYNIRVAHKPITTLGRLLTNARDKDKREDRQRAVHKIKCCDCQVS